MCACLSHEQTHTHTSYHINVLVFAQNKAKGLCKQVCLCETNCPGVGFQCCLQSINKLLATFPSINSEYSSLTSIFPFPPFPSHLPTPKEQATGMRDYTNKPIYSHFQALIDPFTQPLDQSDISYFTLSIRISASTLPFKSLEQGKVDMIMHLQWNC